MSYLKPPHGAPALRPAHLRQIDLHRIDDRRAGLPQVLDRRHEDLHDFRIGRVALVRLAQDADARALQAVAHERGAIVGDRRGCPAGRSPGCT